MKSYIQGLITGSVLVFSFMVLTGQKSESKDVVIDGKLIRNWGEYELATRKIDSDCCDFRDIEWKLIDIEEKVEKIYKEIKSPLFRF